MIPEKIWLSSPHMGGTEQKYIDQAFAANWVAPLGPNVDGFEEDLQRCLGEGTFVAALSSGTAAVHLGLILLGVQAGDEVLCQSFTFSASVNPVVYLGAVPVFLDSEPHSWGICPDVLEQAIKDRISKGKKPKAIIAVHLYGMPYKVNEVKAVAERYGIPVLEDSAEALGSSYNGRKCGTFGNVAALSFNGNKIITTSGGGALAVKDKSLKEKAIYLATQARNDKPYYYHTEIGYNYRMSNISAGIGRGQMEVLERNIELRRNMHAFYNDALNGVSGVTVFSEYDPLCYCNYWLTAIVVEPGQAKNDVEYLRKAFLDNNIEARPLWKPMHTQPVFEKYLYYGGNVSEGLFNKGLCLPSGSNLTDGDRSRIYDVLCETLI